jgi:hypothetical protein
LICRSCVVNTCFNGKNSQHLQLVSCYSIGYAHGMCCCPLMCDTLRVYVCVRAFFIVAYLCSEQSPPQGWNVWALSTRQHAFERYRGPFVRTSKRSIATWLPLSLDEGTWTRDTMIMNKSVGTGRWHALYAGSVATKCSYGRAMACYHVREICFHTYSFYCWHMPRQ